MRNRTFARRFIFTLHILMATAAFAHSGEFHEEKRYGDAKSLGEWQPFYRYQAVIANAGISGDLIAIPEWWTQTDFPYIKRPFDKEIPFADGLSIVRLLGGWHEGLPEEIAAEFPYGDLVTRDDNGALQFSGPSVLQRIQPYWEQGYRDLTLVLDNFPTSLTSDPQWKEYGQVRHPDNVEEWRWMIGKLIQTLDFHYAQEHRFRFRLGTEMQDYRRFIGDYAEYKTLYRIIAEELKSADSTIKLGPFNRSMPLVEETGKPGPDNICLIRLVQDAAWAKPGTPLPFDFISRSMYYFERIDENGAFINVLPEDRIPGLAQYWERLERIDPRYRNISREIHEFGALNSYQRIYGLETGARGAARMHDTIVKLVEENISRLWHWRLTETIGNKRLLSSHAWLYMVYDQFVGGEAFTTPVEWQHADKATEAEIQGRALWIRKADTQFLVVSAWHPDRAHDSQAIARLEIPQTWWNTDLKFAGELDFNTNTSIYDRLHQDLLGADNLAQRHLATDGAHITTIQKRNNTHMAADRDAGIAMILDRWEHYESMMSESLRLKPTADIAELSEQSVKMEFSTQVPSVRVFVWNKVGLADGK
jgi:hypothetical protein